MADSQYVINEEDEDLQIVESLRSACRKGDSDACEAISSNKKYQEIELALRERETAEMDEIKNAYDSGKF